MGANVFKVVELAGQSEKSLDDAIRSALERANKTIHGVRWFQVMDTRGHVENGRVAQWQVVLKVGFGLDD